MIITKAIVSKDHKGPTMIHINLQADKNYSNNRPLSRINTKDNMKRRRSYCVLSAIIAFMLGLMFGVLIVSNRTDVSKQAVKANTSQLNYVKEPKIIESFNKVSFTESPKRTFSHGDTFPEGMTEEIKDILKDNRILDVKIKLDKFLPNNQTVLFDNIYWGPQVENALPEGYDEEDTENWEEYLKNAEVVKIEFGCGRMQNRLVTFRDGMQACVRYRQNTDQIQGEIFSFYLGRLMKLTNLAPSAVSLVDVRHRMWRNVAHDLGRAQWNTNRAVVLTQYIPDLESARIPDVFKPYDRHLNKFDVKKMSVKENDTIVNNVLLDKLQKRVKKVDADFDRIDTKVGDKVLTDLLELAQWSDLIVFDYLTANLDRIVNNLFNFQWNVNIMDGPAHNLARRTSGLLMFLDNESGLLHGYRLLMKYNGYHSVMLDNLCVFRRSTIEALRYLYKDKSLGKKLIDAFKKKNNALVRDVLPPLPEKNIKILYDRIDKVLNQVFRCEQMFAKR